MRIRRWLVAFAVVGLVGAGTATAVWPVESSQIWTVAGNGDLGFSGDGGPATTAQLQFPSGVAVDAGGNILIADKRNHRVRRVTPAGTITTIAGTGTPAFNGDGIAATTAQLNFPSGLAVDAGGNILIADSQNHRVRRVTPAGTITTVAGTGTPGFNGDGIAATSAQLDGPAAVAVDAAGNIFIAETNNRRIRRVTPAGTITTVAGDGTAGSGGDNGPATSAQLIFPSGVAVDTAGNIYIADSSSHRVRRVSSTGTITAFAGTGVQGISGDDGPAVFAQLNFPDGVAVGQAGNIIIADTSNNRVRLVTPAGTITTIAGTGISGFGGDGGAGTTAQLQAPKAVAVDTAGNILIADQDNNRVRWMTGPQAGKTGATGAAGGVGATGPAGPQALPRIVASAFATVVTRNVVRVRYVMTDRAVVTLTVKSKTVRATVVTATTGRFGLNTITWNRRIAGKPAKPGSYTLTVTARANGTTSTTTIRATIR